MKQLGLFVLIFLLAPGFVLAQSPGPLESGIADAGKLADEAGLVEGGKSASEILLGFIGWVLSFVAIIALAVLIWGGIRYIISVGNENDIQAARKTIQWAVIGLIIVLLSFAIITAIQASLGL